MKKELFSINLPRGNRVWVEQSAFGPIFAKADMHPDDPHICLHLGSPRQCVLAARSFARAIRHNFRGRIQFPVKAQLSAKGAA